MNEEMIEKAIKLSKSYTDNYYTDKFRLEAFRLKNELEQEKEKNKKLKEGIRQIKDKLEIADYYNCQDGADELTRLLQES